MANLPSIKVYDNRSFGDNFNMAFTFLGHHARPFFKAHLHISMPIMLLTAIVTYFLTSETFGNVDPQVSGGFIGSPLYIATTFGTAVLSALFVAVVTLVTLVYLQRQQDGSTPSPADIHSEIWRYLWPLVLLGILVSLAIGVGFVLLIIPGFYLMGKLALAFPALVMEKQGALDAMQRSFEISKEHWWGSIGSLILSSLVGGVISLVFVLPGIIIFGLSAFLSIQDGAAAQESLTGWSLATFTLLSLVGRAFSTIFVVLVIALYYGAKVEAKEARSLMDDIEGAS